MRRDPLLNPLSVHCLSLALRPLEESQKLVLGISPEV